MNEKFFKVKKNDDEDINFILNDINLLNNEFKLSKEQSDEIDNYILQIHKEYVLDKKKKRFFLPFIEFISNFVSNIKNIGYLKPAIAMGVLIIAATIFIYFLNLNKKVEIATNVNEVQPEKILEAPSPLKTDSETSVTPLQEEKSKIEKNDKKEDIAVNTQKDFNEKDELEKEHFSLFRANEVNTTQNEGVGQGKGSEQILSRGFEIKLDTMIADYNTKKDIIAIEPKQVITENKDLNELIKSDIPLQKMYSQVDLGKNLVFDGKFYKSPWRQLTFQNKPINFKIRSVYQKDKFDNLIFVKYDFEKLDKIDKSLETFQLEATGINLDSLLKMQEY
ncbi:MAG: hypothetical protein N2319_02115 [Candidatus Kapabacteria bacterium]|nr:hypothetical protein [Candidatus Kapabacteria bacterium]